MAELAGEISTRAQLAAIAAVRWRLMLNSMRTARGTMEVVAQVGASVWLAILGSGGGIGFGVATWYFLSHGQPAVLLLFAWGLFLFWQIFPLAATAFTEQADTSNLTRFPLSFRAYVIVRVAFGAFDVATLVGSLCLLGSVVGAACASPALLPWAVAGALLFAAFNVVLAQTIFAWIERWLARRKTREIVMVLFFFVIIGFQFIGPIARHWSGARVDVGAMAAWLPLAEWLPPGLAVHALGQAAAGAWLTAAGAVLELAGCAAATTALLGVRLRADFRGELLGETVGATPKAKVQAEPKPRAVEARFEVPGFSGVAGAVAQKELRYLLRSPMMFFSLAMPVVILVLFRMEAFSPVRGGRGGGHVLARGALGGFAFPIGTAYALLMLMNLVFNVFGTDAAGVQLYFMAPVRIEQVLRGKNLAHATLLGAETVILFFAAWMIGGPPIPWTVAATLIGLTFGLLCDFSAGNLVSLYLPKKIDLSRLGRQNARGTTGLIALALQGGMALLVAVAVGGGILFHRVWLSLSLLALLAALAAAAYWLVLQRVDGIAAGRRETLTAELSKA
ncbi:MAG TPA: hypothetical protein VN690_11835 [Terriglobales bacterium]|nr:hypothetical protein [Terriglobales bacterium]